MACVWQQWGCCGGWRGVGWGWGVEAMVGRRGGGGGVGEGAVGVCVCACTAGGGAEKGELQFLSAAELQFFIERTVPAASAAFCGSCK